ncbi:MAG: hypothetical protein ACI841_000492 [Planctomycetota bacterium]|jgi:hypothetical protein
MQVLEQLKSLSDETFHKIYDSLAQQGFGPMDGEVAKAMKFRPQAIRKLAMDQRAKRARSILLRSNNSEMTYEIFGSYLISQHKGLVSGFLDATGVEHDDCMIQNIDEAKPDVAKLGEAIKTLDESFDASDVTLYLALCAEQWPQVPELDSMWRMRV